MPDESLNLSDLPALYPFPDPKTAGSEGLVAYGGDLSAGRVLAAYMQGLFPWFGKDDPILWWSPDPRMIIVPAELKIGRSFRRVLKNRSYEVRFDYDFEAVIRHCSTVGGRSDDTWLGSDMIEAYIRLHRAGFAHSVEVYSGHGELFGGLYGLAIGGGFFGESMFSISPDGSKIALKALSDVLSERGYDFVDCQIVTDHLSRMGAEAVSRCYFLEMLKESLKKPSDRGSWSDFKWEYSR